MATEVANIAVAHNTAVMVVLVTDNKVQAVENIAAVAVVQVTGNRAKEAVNIAVALQVWVMDSMVSETGYTVSAAFPVEMVDTDWYTATCLSRCCTP